MCDPITAAALITGGSSLLNSATSPSPTAGSNINLTRGGANSFQSQIQPLLETLMKGGNAPDIENLKAFYDQGEKNLFGAQQRSVGMAGAEAGANSLAHGYNNPGAAMNLGMGKVGGQYAGQFGQLAGMRASGLFEANRGLLKELLGLTQGNVGMGANPGGGSAPAPAPGSMASYNAAKAVNGNPRRRMWNGQNQFYNDNSGQWENQPTYNG